MGRKLVDSLRAEQRELVDYWSGLSEGRGLPKRGQIHPGEIRRWLSRLSVLELERGGRLKFRLSGSHLRDAFGRDARGRYVHDMSGLCERAWDSEVRRAVEEGRPMAGITELDGRIVHAWLRLPMICEHSGAAVVLCHDRYPTAASAGGDVEETTSVQQSNGARVQSEPSGYAAGSAAA